jgi:hypothetical protein
MATTRRQRGAQAVELMAILPLVVLLVACGAQALILVRQQAEAESDARVLVRQAVVCHDGGWPVPAAVDPALRLGDVSFQRDRDSIVVAVRLAPATIIPGISAGTDSSFAPRATVAMLREPC